jgi:hypothetical protein
MGTHLAHGQGNHAASNLDVILTLTRQFSPFNLLSDGGTHRSCTSRIGNPTKRSCDLLQRPDPAKVSQSSQQGDPPFCLTKACADNVIATGQTFGKFDLDRDFRAIKGCSEPISFFRN